MLKRLYVDNYKCLVNFEFTFQPLQLLIGRNGTGKSTVFDLLPKLGQIADGAIPISAVFPPETLTRWDKRTVQTFELEMDGNGGAHHYQITIEHDPLRRDARVLREYLAYDKRPLFASDRGQAKIYQDYGGAGSTRRLDDSRSGLSLTTPRQDNTRLTWFKDRLCRIYSVHFNPYKDWAASAKDHPYPEWDMSVSPAGTTRRPVSPASRRSTTTRRGSSPSWSPHPRLRPVQPGRQAGLAGRPRGL